MEDREVGVLTPAVKITGLQFFSFSLGSVYVSVKKARGAFWTSGEMLSAHLF